MMASWIMRIHAWMNFLVCLGWFSTTCADEIRTLSWFNPFCRHLTLTLMILATKSSPNWSMASWQDSTSSAVKGSGMVSGSTIMGSGAGAVTAAGSSSLWSWIGMRADSKDGLFEAESAWLRDNASKLVQLAMASSSNWSFPFDVVLALDVSLDSFSMDADWISGMIEFYAMTCVFFC